MKFFRYDRLTGQFTRKKSVCLSNEIAETYRNHVLFEAKKHPFLSFRDLAFSLNQSLEPTISHSSVRDILHELGKRSYATVFKPKLNKESKIKRLEFTKTAKRLGDKIMKSCIYSDETKISINPKKHNRVLREKGTGMNTNHLELSNAHPIKVMVWGCIGYGKVVRLEICEQHPNSHTYVDVLSRNLRDSIEQISDGSFTTFKQDNAPCHRAKLTLNWLRENSLSPNTWPPYSPDLNPIENVCWKLKNDDAKEGACSSVAELKQRILTAWNNLSSEFICSLFDSLPNR